MEKYISTGFGTKNYLLRFDGVTCPGCITAIKNTVSQLESTDIVDISETSGDVIIRSAIMLNSIEKELKEFEGCCSDCQIGVIEAEETDLDTLDTQQDKQDSYGLVRKQYKVALERALQGIEVACSDNCVCKTTDVDRLSEADGAPSFASVYNLSERIGSYLGPDMMVTDFGCGTGHDAIRIARIVNPGIVTGIDVTPEMVDFATAQVEAKGIQNTRFMVGHDLTALEDNSQDRIFVNNVLNLLDDKVSFLWSAFDKLLPKGLLIIADEFALEEFPNDLRNDEAFQCGGISGAEHVDEMERISISVGFKIINWDYIKEYSIDYKSDRYSLKTAILILEKS